MQLIFNANIRENKSNSNQIFCTNLNECITIKEKKCRLEILTKSANYFIIDLNFVSFLLKD